MGTSAGPTGTLQATGDVTAYFSDIRLKDNIQTIDDAGSKLYALQGVFYRQNQLAEQFGYHDYSTRVGLLAQQVQSVLPEAVTPAPFDIDSDGNSRSGECYLSLQYERLIPLIIETIKEQQAEIERYERMLLDNGH